MTLTRNLPGENVTIIIPNAKIAARWNGALQARLRAAPLERFLRMRSLKFSAAGQTRVTDNLASATIHLVGEAIGLCVPAAKPLTTVQHATVGQISCSVASGLALLIQEPAYWRTGSLVATARLLERYIGLSAAAHVAAAAARDYSSAINAASPDVDILKIGHAARQAVETNAEEDVAATIDLISHRLSIGIEATGAPVGKQGRTTYRIASD